MNRISEDLMYKIVEGLRTSIINPPKNTKYTLDANILVHRLVGQITGTHFSAPAGRVVTDHPWCIYYNILPYRN